MEQHGILCVRAINPARPGIELLFVCWLKHPLVTHVNFNPGFAGTQLIIISNTNWVGENVPCLTYGMRGMLSLSVQVSGLGVHEGWTCMLSCCIVMDGMIK